MPTDFYGDKPPRGPIGPGSILGQRFRLDAVIGSGGMATVYRAVDLLQLGDPRDPKVQAMSPDQVPAHARVAIKVISTQYLMEPRVMAAFREEVRKARLLRHEHIVQVHELFEEEGRFYISMELLEGHSLADEVGGEMPLQRVLEILPPVVEALEYAHGRRDEGIKGMIHRDVSPHNIFLARSGVRLIDFGISHFLYETAVTRSGLGLPTAGTPAYMSPERFRGARPDVRDDVYGLAVVVYECLTGRKPFIGPACHERSENIYPPQPRQLSRRQWALLKQALHVQRDKRLANLGGCLKDCGSGRRPVGRRPCGMRPGRRWWRWWLRGVSVTSSLVKMIPRMGARSLWSPMMSLSHRNYPTHQRRNSHQQRKPRHLPSNRLPISRRVSRII